MSDEQLPFNVFDEAEINLMVGVMENDGLILTQEELRVWLKLQKYTKLQLEETEELDKRTLLDPEDPDYIPF